MNEGTWEERQKKKWKVEETGGEGRMGKRKSMRKERRQRKERGV